MEIKYQLDKLISLKFIVVLRLSFKIRLIFYVTLMTEITFDKNGTVTNTMIQQM